MAASIQMDTIAAAGPSRTETVTIFSEGYEQPFMLNLEDLETIPGDSGTLSLLAGIFQGCRACGFHVHGFQACISTNVLSAAGVLLLQRFDVLPQIAVERINRTRHRSLAGIDKRDPGLKLSAGEPMVDEPEY